MIIGYARVSREDQDLGRQVKALQEAGCHKIYEDKISGAKANRPNLDLLLSEVKSGDVIVVQKLDRLGRSLRHLMDLVMSFKDKGVGFRSLTEGFDTTTSAGELIFHIIGAIAQFERTLISERTKNALAFKKSVGVRLGRPDKDFSDDITRLKMLQDTGINRHQIMSTMGISKTKYYDLKSKIE